MHSTYSCPVSMLSCIISSEGWIPFFQCGNDGSHPVPDQSNSSTGIWFCKNLLFCLTECHFAHLFTRAVPTAIHPGYERKSSSCRYNHPHESAHIQSRPLPVLSLSVPRYQRRTQGDANHRLPGGLHASADFPRQKSPTLFTH